MAVKLAGAFHIFIYIERLILYISLIHYFAVPLPTKYSVYTFQPFSDYFIIADKIYFMMIFTIIYRPPFRRAFSYLYFIIDAI